MVLTIEQQQDFIRDGYLRVTDVFTDDQTRQLRAAMERIFDSPSPYEGDSDTGRADIFCRYQELRWVLVHPPLVRVLKDLLGEDFVYIHEMSGHQNVFSPWHKDTTSVELRGNSFHWKPNYLMVECAIYLQDNDGRGGGLTVLPGSHNLYDRYKARAQGAPMQNGYAAVEQVGAPPAAAEYSASCARLSARPRLRPLRTRPTRTMGSPRSRFPARRGTWFSFTSASTTAAVKRGCPGRPITASWASSSRAAPTTSTWRTTGPGRNCGSTISGSRTDTTIRPTCAR